MANTYPHNSAVDDINLGRLFGVLWLGKWLIVGISTIVGIVAVVVTMMMPNIYRSEALLAPAEESNGGGLTALAGQLGGLASLAGVNFGEERTSKVTIGLEVLKSRAFLSFFIKHRDVLVPLMAGEKWDASSGRLLLDKNLYDESKQLWVGASANPSDWKAYQAFIEIMKVSVAKDTGLITLSIDHPSAEIAKQWVTWLIDDLNEQLRKRDIEEAQRSIDYLKLQLNQTPLAEMQQIFYQLIEKQTQTIMLANVREQYVFKIIDPPIVSEEKVSPRRASIVVMSVMMAIVVSVALVLVMAAYRNTNREFHSTERMSGDV